jgi:cytochrome c553
MSTRTFTVAATVMLLVLPTACQTEVADVPTSECASGKKWVGGNSGSSQMHPGRDCIACHANEGAPQYLVAGTVYPVEGLGDGDDCFGIAGASVLVEDAAGRAFALETNSAGNFYLARGDGPLELPLSVEVEYDGVMQAMTLQPAVGACASCHTADGLGGALGRIIRP